PGDEATFRETVGSEEIRENRLEAWQN
ncbi:MAG: hypothetical protein JWN25_3214, partial [Verrucomicrobiales bacterium]|nr:hypothetical protein [Verrucomicrobiales bacterium]